MCKVGFALFATVACIRPCIGDCKEWSVAASHFLAKTCTLYM